MNRMIWRGITVLLATCVAVLLSSCGSGAVTGTPTPDPAAGTPLAVSPPIVDLFPDLPTTFTVTGGTSPYTAFSSNGAVLPITATVAGSTFSVIPNAVPADTAIDITVRDAANGTATSKATVKPSTLINQITFTPFGPTATGCGTNALCSGGDAQIVVKAVQNGVVLRNRSIRFDAFKGDFQFVVLATGAKVNSLVVNSDEQGEATVRITANVGAATQVATIQTTDVSSGLSRRYNFNIVQQVSGVGILSTLPSGDITFTGAKGPTGGEGFCPGGSVDYYIFGGTPPYNVVSPLPAVASVTPSSVGTTGGRFTAQINGCGKVAFIVTDATGRTIETSSLNAVRGANGDTVTLTPASLTVAPALVSIVCNGSGSVTVAGNGTFSTFPSGTGPNGAPGTGFSVNPPQGAIPNTVSFNANPGTIFSPISVDFRNGTLIQRVIVTVTGTVAGSCP